MRRPVFARALLLIFSILATAAVHADTLKPYQATFEGVWHGMVVAVSSLKLEQTGDTWTYTSRSEPRGIGRLASGIFPPLQVSTVRVTDAGVLPQSYRSNGGDADKSIDLTYNWQAHRVTGTYEGAKVDLPLTPKVQDDASIQLAIMVELLAGRTPSSFEMIDKNSVRDYNLSKDGETTVQTPLGPVPTVIFKAQKAYSPRVTRFWCAPDRGYIPVKVEQTKGDDVQWTLRLQSLTRN